MHSTRKKQLQEKGWKITELKEAECILERAEHHDVFFSQMVFWSALLVIIFANLVVSLILIPFLIVLNQYVLYAIIILLAGTVGFLYNFLIMDIDHLEKKHHLLAGIIVPILALTNVVAMVLVSNLFITDLKIQDPHNPWIIGIIFGLAFILPYLIDRLRK